VSKTIIPNRARVTASGHDCDCSQAHNLGTPTECLTEVQPLSLVCSTGCKSRKPRLRNIQNLGAVLYLRTAQREIVAQCHFVAQNTKFVAQGNFVAEYNLRNVLNILFCSTSVFTTFLVT